MSPVLLPALLVAAVIVPLVAWTATRRTVQVPCRLDLEATHEHFHAHAELEGIAVREGDEVQVAGAPSRVPYGTRRTIETSATVRQASWPRRLLVRLIGTTHITDLYDVGFEG